MTFKVWQFSLLILLLISSKSFSQNDSWQVLTDAANPVPSRTAGVSFTIGNKAYVGTGSSMVSGFSNDFWEYDPASGTWSQKADFAGAGRQYASGFSIGNKGYIGTGLLGTRTTEITNDFWEYDPSLNTWVRKADVPGRGRFSGVGFSLKGKGYIATGYDWFSIFADCNEYNPLNNTWTANAALATPRFNATCFIIGDKAYVGTGSKSFYQSGLTESKDFFEFDPAKRTWTAIADYPGTPTTIATAFSLMGKGYVIPGNPSSNELWQYSPLSNSWLGKSPVPGDSRRAASAFSIGEKGYLVFGTTTVGSNDMLTYQITAADNLKAVYTGKNYVHLDWEDFNSINGISAYDIYVDGVKKYNTTESAFTVGNLAPNTSYTFTVIGKDLGGNSTQASNAVVVKTTDTSAGLNYRYYAGNWDVLPNFNALAPIRSGHSTNVDLSARNAGVNEQFGFVWEGTINVPTPGNYTFETVSRDGSKFYFNSYYSPSATALVNNDGIHTSFATATGTVNVPVAGSYPIALSFFEKNGGASLQVYWTGPAGSGITRQLIPDAAFGTGYTSIMDTTAPSAPGNLKAVTVARNFVSLDWDNSTDNVGIASYNVYVNGVKRISTTNSEIIIDSLLENSTYTFSVNATDLAGNTSAFSNTFTSTTINTRKGLSYRFYEGNWNNLPDFNELTPVKIGSSPNIDINVRPSGINDHFGFVWEGTINIFVPGEYKFETVSDDGSKIYVNSLYAHTATAVVNNDGVHGPWAPVTGVINIPAAGQYPFAVSFFEKDSGESMQVYWTGPAGSGISRQLIPDYAFAAEFLPPRDSIAPTAPANVRSVASSRNTISLAWNTATDNVGVALYDVYIDGVKKYSTSNAEIVIDSLVENTSYTFTIKARDAAGNTSAFSNAITLKTTNVSYGLNYRYYEGDWNTLPDFNTLTPVKKGLSPNFDISVRPAGVNDHFAFVWEGKIFINTPGTYTFETVSDDGSRLYFNSTYSPMATPLINNDGIHGPWAPVVATVNIPAAGEYPITLTYFEKDGGESMAVYYTGPAGSGIQRQLIPDAAFRGFQGPNDLMAPTGLKALSVSADKISLDWDNSTYSQGAFFYDIYVDGIKKYSSTVSEIIADGFLANTTYTIYVKVRDAAGNTSLPGAPITVTTGQTVKGLTYRYYEGNWDNLPIFDAMVPLKTGLSSNIDISVRPEGVNDHFGFAWDGFINFPVPGVYTFETISDDGSRLHVNTPGIGQFNPMLDNNGIHGPWQSVKGTVNIPAPGNYPLTVSYFEKDGGESMQVYWTGPPGSGINRQLLPDSVLTPRNTAPVGATPATPKSLMLMGVNPTAFKMEVDYGIVPAGVVRYDVYVDGTKKFDTTSAIIIAPNLLPDTRYSVKVKAVNAAGISSDFSNEVTYKTQFTADGLDYRYYEGDWNALPDFTALTPVKKGTSANIDINVRPAGRNDHFAIQWEGSIRLPVPGTYTFETVSDDGSTLDVSNNFLGAGRVVNNDGLHPATSSSGTFNSTRGGICYMRVSYFEKDGDEKMEVYWTGPGIPRQRIPTSAFVRYIPMETFSAPNLTDVLGTTSEQANGVANIKMYPNPFRESFQVAFNNSATGNKVSVGLFDLTGRLIEEHNMRNLPAGNNVVPIQVKEGRLTPGIYLARLKVNGRVVKSVKMIKLKE